MIINFVNRDQQSCSIQLTEIVKSKIKAHLYLEKEVNGKVNSIFWDEFTFKSLIEIAHYITSQDNAVDFNKLLVNLKTHFKNT